MRRSQRIQSYYRAAQWIRRASYGLLALIVFALAMPFPPTPVSAPPATSRIVVNANLEVVPARRPMQRLQLAGLDTASDLTRLSLAQLMTQPITN